MAHKEIATVLWNRAIAPGYYKMGLAVTTRFRSTQPGQFVMVRFKDQKTPLLSRPFSIHKVQHSNTWSDFIELLYKVVGSCTAALSTAKNGDNICILGPLGNSFVIPENLARACLVAGGIGIAPMTFLLSALIDSGIGPFNIHIIVGGRSKNDLLGLDVLAEFKIRPTVTTDDGSAGHMGLVIQPLEQVLHTKTPPDIIYACGPHLMLKAVAEIAQKHHIPCQISIETMMACGMGACLGCAVESKTKSSKFLHACIDGPVFDAAKLNL
jgi:dihydroorotate dehydrogenase electron transfer subunit